MRLRNVTYSTIALKFGIAGFILAIGIAYLLFGFFWVFVPGVVLSALGAGAVATYLGRKLETQSANPGFSLYLICGAGVALLTLLAGVVVLGVTNTVIAIIDEVFQLGFGLGPWFSLAHTVVDFIIKPVLAVMMYGGPIAGIIGLAYGAKAHAKQRKAKAA